MGFKTSTPKTPDPAQRAVPTDDQAARRAAVAQERRRFGDEDTRLRRPGMMTQGGAPAAVTRLKLVGGTQ